MPRTKISEYSATANSNTDVAGVNVDEGCAPSGINNAIRAVMGHLKDFQTGAVGDAFNGPTVGAHNGTVGATTPAAGTFTTLSATGNVTLGDAAADTVTVNGTTNFVVAPTVGGVGQNGFKNRLINSDMRIDQRNAGNPASLTSSQTYFLDRWFAVEDTDGTMTIQQSSTAPAGFTNSTVLTTGTADASLGASQICYFAQKPEGYNVADLGWGTASAATVTLSFWVRSSLTGTFGGAIANNAFNRSYPFSYTISAANTFEYKTITIAGDTSGTWLNTNGAGLQVFFGLGVGSTFSGTAGAWAGAGYISATGATSVIGTAGATFYITGVQLEKGSTATSFDYRPYGTELQLCQRYLPAYNFSGTNQPSAAGIAYSASASVMNLIHPVQTRVAPTGITVTGTFNSYNSSGGNTGNFSSIGLGASQGTFSSILNCTGASGMVAGNATILLSPTGTSQILLTGCEL